VTSTAATPVTHASDPADEILREARERLARGTAAKRARIVQPACGLISAIAFGVAAAELTGGPAFSLWRTVLFVVLYAAVSRVEFEIGSGVAVPTQLILVPMLFALPTGIVPAAVAAAILLRMVADRPSPLRQPIRAVSYFANAAHALGPALVIALAHGLPLRWNAWPVYVAALLAQLGMDFATAAVVGAANGIRLRAIAGFTGLAYTVDTALAPIGLMVAFATRTRPELVILVLPLVLLLRVFARERKQRIDHALELSDAYRGTAFLLGDVVEADDAYTGSHSRHVVDLVLGVADELGLDPAERRDAEFVALLHDVGKIRIPAEIINKPGALTDEERAVIETHTIEGEQMLERVGGLLGHVGRLVRSCHERWDGGGYPDGLAGEQIPLIARIVCACDAFSAMTTDRPYRSALTRNAALAELARCSGTHFDPQVVAAILRIES